MLLRIGIFAALGGFLYGCVSCKQHPPGICPCVVLCTYASTNPLVVGLRAALPCRYDLGLIGGALFSIRDEFHLSKVAEEWVVGSAKLGAFFGTFLGGAMMLHYGRRKTIAIDSLFYMAGPLVMAASYNFT